MSIQKEKEQIVELDYKPYKLLIYAESRVEKESRAFSCKKEPETVKWIESNFKKGDIAFDIGANIGAYALIMSRIIGSKGMVYAFEPSWPNFYHLNKNIILNKCQSNTTALNIALSSDKKISNFNYRDLEFGSSLHTFDTPVDFVGNIFTPKVCQPVLSYSVDQFVKEFNIGHVNHIKLDVDGHEAEIIKGAKKILQSKVCRSMMVEFNEEFKADLECIDFLKFCSFKIVSKQANPSVICKSDSIYNYIFVKS